ncbi:hypothetical protein PGIGA_G00191750 [Pangasianodon gigas]|uniref:Uncharacterized protein n=1 Tax=Pangasianodon gigas TaxID=30993 RepID=A0ACC5WEF4_PANGG|nr:hypothetical protein [Pangasianodon gigas]
MFLSSSTAFFLFFITLSTFPSTPKSIETIAVQVIYSRHPVRGTEGQPLTLKCSAQYDKQQCGNISVYWCLLVLEKSCQPLTDPDRYLIHINETQISGETVFRQRDAFVTFTRLTLNDTGFYQCKAVCQHTETTAMGHLINVTVTGQEETTNIFFTGGTNNGQKIRSDRCSVVFLLTISSVFILLWSHQM